eukprot:CAMPEP_0171310898 /NCGR_PEP_ID=MMETSP0816-20121228/21095_1 /TAXON_ID=420281 /ORGANISM="Proboscia inermis, Strain CCAP1064/1" /LENGTH=44 /DNA_ID= /DNA_START= /DNA_END= /DNA_ORIENTATION=
MTKEGIQEAVFELSTRFSNSTSVAVDGNEDSHKRQPRDIISLSM